MGSLLRNSIFCFLFIGLIGLGIYLFQRHCVTEISSTSPICFSQNIFFPRESGSIQPTIPPFPQVKLGQKQYTNKYLGFGFSYPDYLSLTEYDSHSGKLEYSNRQHKLSLVFAADFLMDYGSDPIKGLEIYDFCNTSLGYNGYVRCQNRVNEFTNSNGIRVYKVEMKTSENKQPGSFQQGNLNHVYVVPLLRLVNGSGYAKYDAVFFTMEWPSVTNLLILRELMDSVFTF